MPNNMLDSDLDDIDVQIIRILRRYGRATNKEIAAAVGIPQSTCLVKIRRLVENKTIKGFHAELDVHKLGRPLQAFVSIRLGIHSRQENNRFLNKLVEMPGVLSVSLMTGDDDYMVHVAAKDSESLSNFVLDEIT
ncbi:MAG: Lrp/AsnC family transcriptional regulator, partial [Microbacteriaceae bacterium]